MKPSDPWGNPWNEEKDLLRLPLGCALSAPLTDEVSVCAAYARQDAWVSRGLDLLTPTAPHSDARKPQGRTLGLWCHLGPSRLSDSNLDQKQAQKKPRPIARLELGEMLWIIFDNTIL